MMMALTSSQSEANESEAATSIAAVAPRGLLVCAGEDCSVWMPPEAVGASTVLQMLVADELADGCAGNAEAEDMPSLLSVPIPAFADPGSMRSGLQQIAGAFQQGFPLALRWARGDVRGLQAAVSLLSCAHFLDIQLVAAEACDELGRSLAACSDAAKVFERFGVGLGAPPAERRPQLGDEAQELAEHAPILGDRGSAFAEVWANDQSPLAGLPTPCIREIATRAGAIVEKDVGVRDLLRVAHSESGIFDAAAELPSSPLGKAASAANGDDTSRSAGVSIAVDIVCARWQLYSGSQPLAAALSILARSEDNPPELRVRCIHTIEQVASPGDASAVGALCEILHAEPSVSLGPPAVGEQSPMDEFLSRIQLDRAWQVRAAACSALVKIACAGNAEVVQALCAAVGHGYFEVRSIATHSLGRMAQAGDCQASESLLGALSDDDWRVREAAIEALAKLSSGALPVETGLGQEGDALLAAVGLVPLVCDRLGHKAADVRQAARAALQGMAAQCGRLYVARLVVLGVSHAAPGRRVPLLRRPLPEVRRAAVEVLGDALGALAGELADVEVPDARCADQPALPQGVVDDSFEVGLVSVVRALSDRQAFVRQTAASALGGYGSSHAFPPLPRSQIASHALDVVHAGLQAKSSSSMEEVLEVLRVNATRGDQAVVTSVRDVLLCTEAPPGTRQAAARALSCLAAPGDHAATDALVRAASEASDYSVSEEAFQGIEALSVGDGREVKAVVAVVEATSMAVAIRRRALRSLTKVAQVGDRAALACAIAALQSSEASMRGEALGVVVRVAEPGDTAAKALVAAHLGDSDQDVCKRAMDACEVIAELGDTHMIDALVQHVVGGESNLQQMAVRTLQRVCRLGDPGVLSRLLPWTEQGHWPQRKAAIEALGVLAPRGHEAALAAMMQRICDSDGTCRQSACEALGHVAAPGDDTVVSALVALLEDPSWLVRDAAGLSLAKVVNSSHVPMLEDVIGRVAEDTCDVAEEALAVARRTECAQN